MNFKAAHKEFAVELSAIKGSVDTRNSTPMQGLLHMQIKADSVILTANNMDFGIRSRIKATAKEPGAIVLDASKLDSWVSKTSDESLTINITKTRATFKAGKSSIGIATGDVSNFPSFPASEEAIGKIPAAELGSILSGVNFVVADFEDPRFNYAGAQVKVVDDKLTVAATNGQRLAVSTHAFTVALKAMKCVISRKAVMELIKLCAKSTVEDVAISISGNNLFFNFGNRMMYCRRLPDNFPGYEKAMPDPGKQLIAVVEPAALVSAIGRVATLCEQSKRIFLTIEPGKISLLNTSQAGECDDIVYVEYEGPTVKFGVNSSWLAEALKVTGETADLAFDVNPRSPVEVRKHGSLAYRNIISIMDK